MNYEIVYHKNFFKDIRKLSTIKQGKIKEILREILNIPTVLPPNSQALKGYDRTFRTRVGKLRLIYHINHDKKEVYVLGLDTRGEVYKIIRRLLD
ncbi:MAG: Cytotoxic translational repressor of toxin-antitoxin stability system [Candidatus Woesebacteria bacterium GW2011_GWA1_39_8]|uniref:Cytotoxic translational repressor of toxin-antitoxin stability system n=1 Tax=Candidatus Woesebacteria bacterium GW2011_GWA1_39_8 TaxID=1618552 RepID=A0A0G0PQB9_9BACT|nr:MAG: Cytotoxic translational repressor of toxin-antitoxin stability system [Candidatus Woesebacteria bacterium GW2011_GWA1_39_8]